MKSGRQASPFLKRQVFAVKFSANPGHCRHRKIMLQTWKVASQQCESYGWDRLFIYRDKYGLASSSHVWFPDLGDNLGDLATKLATLATKYGISKVLESSRYFY
ncbi:hypothetical protein AVEN_105858-1 [Araneus ventricosus]|uniref:Uncharacterized protein n=1 Tax=Araneus ventricosus TaxID=182803 RepID=A0A4Y2RGR2_ARAVE|nr:hypothetical protein AVEN_205731-1 [Araneus ventricosus]GBN74946.1 hypothetical protein AVEN_105858-1 [Araneus ventricosus]